MNSLFFTSLPSPRSQATSDIFRQYGITGEIAAPIRECRVSPVSVPTTFLGRILPPVIINAIKVAHFKSELTLAGPSFKNVLNEPVRLHEIFLYPDVTTSFGKSDMAEDIQAIMTSLNFRKESAQGRHYYKGPPNPDSIMKIAMRGGAMDTFAPFGATNFHGFSTLRNLQRLLLSVCAIWPKPLTTSSDPGHLIDLNTWKTASSTRFSSSKLYIIKDFADLAEGEDGLSFPYFDGLVRADKTSVPSIVTRYFLELMGDSQEQAMEAFRIFQNGWLSLSTTPQGLALSHFAVIIDIALRTGAKPYILMPGKVYGGVLLVGKGLQVLKGNRVYKALPFTKVKEDLLQLDTHSRSLIEIANIINPMLFGAQTDLFLDGLSISSPRMLHNLIRHLKIDFETQKAIRKAILGLKFRPGHWDPLNSKHILQAVKTISLGEFLPDEIPMLAQTEILMTKDPILSTLAAFGTSAPTIVGKGASYAIVIKGKKTLLPSMPGGLQLQGFPIFVKPIQEAHEDWVSVKTTSTISYKLRQHQGSAPTIQGLGKTIPFSEGGDTLNEYISVFSTKAKASKEKSNKRGREDKDDGEDEKKRASKKSKSVHGLQDTFAAMGFGNHATIGLADTTGIESDMDV